MGNTNKLFKQSSHYFLGNLIVMVGSLISFPIWTRVFSRTEYGYMSLCVITINFMVAISKFGLQHASLRFYSDLKAKKGISELIVYYSTMVIGSLLLSSLVLSIAGLVSWRFLYHSDSPLVLLIPLMGLIILFRSLIHLYQVFLRVEGKTIFYNIIIIAERYGMIFLAILFVLLFSEKIFGFLVGYFISVIVILGCVSWQYRDKIHIKLFSPSLLWTAAIYGSPLVLREVAVLLLSVGDRYLIQFFMGPESVGIYSVAYNLSDMAQTVISEPLRLAVIPLYLKMWNSDGEVLTQRFLSRILDYYFMVGIPLSIGLSWYGREIITLLTTSKFQAAHEIVPYIIFPMFLNGAFVVFGAGLYIHKKTMVIMWSTLVCATLNLLMNWLFIPKFGLLGAAFATLLSYVMLFFIIYIKASQYLYVRVKIMSIFKYSLLSFGVIGVLSGIFTIDSIIVKMMVGVLLYFAGILILEREIRERSIQFVRNL